MMGMRLLVLVYGLAWGVHAGAGESPDFRQGWEAFLRKDYGTAIRFLVMAADEGDARAARALADIHERGLGTVRDPEQALRWRRLAGELSGEAPAGGDASEAEFWRQRALEAEKREWQGREEIRRLESERRKAPPRDARRSQSLHWGYGLGPRFHDPFWGPYWGPGLGWGPYWGWPGPGIHFGFSQGWHW